MLLQAVFIPDKLISESNAKALAIPSVSNFDEVNIRKYCQILYTNGIYNIH